MEVSTRLDSSAELWLACKHLIPNLVYPSYKVSTKALFFGSTGHEWPFHDRVPSSHGAANLFKW